MDTWSDHGEDPADTIVYIPPPVVKKSNVNKNLIQKIEAIVSSYELQEKYSTRLTLHTLAVIEYIIKKNPEFFRIVESTIVRNIRNNKIDAADIPYLISILSQLYNLIQLLEIDIKPTSETETSADTCGTILKFVFSVAVRENLIKIDDETNATLLLLCCDNIIDSCIKLLKLKPPKPFAVLGITKSAEKADTCC